MILNDDDDDFLGLNVSDVLNYSFSTRVNIDICASISKLSLLKCKCLECAEITKMTHELQNYHFAPKSYVTRFNF